MVDRPRRALLGTLGTSIALAAAGCLSSPDDDAQNESTDDADDADDGDDEGSEDESIDEAEVDQEALFEYVPASVAADEMLVGAASPRRLQEVEPDNFFGSFDELGLEPEDIEAMAMVDVYDETAEASFAVIAPTADPDGEPESHEFDGATYDRYDVDDVVAVAVDDVIVVAESIEPIEDAIVAADDANRRLIETHDAVADGIEETADADVRWVILEEEEIQLADLDADDVRYSFHSQTIVDPDTADRSFGFEVRDGDVITDDLLAEFESEFDYLGGEPTVDVDGPVVTVTARVDLAAEREVQDHESPSGLRVRDVDLDATYVEIEITRGEETPVDELALELDGETYDPDVWADGQDSIEEGDVVLIRTADVEPALEVTLRHEVGGAVSASSTSILGNLEFAFERDGDVVTVEYADSIALDGDELVLAAFDADHAAYDEEADRSTRPWTGTEVAAGDRGTIGGVEPGDQVVVCWGEPSLQNAVAHYYVEPPGRAVFEYDDDEGVLSVTLELDEPRSAEEYTIVAGEDWDGESPTDEQFTDRGETVSSGETVRVAGLEYGDVVRVVWDDDVDVGQTWITPDVEIAVDVDGDELTVEHDGGPAVAADRLTVFTWGEDDHVEYEVAAEIDGEFAPGDAVTVDVGDLDPEFVSLILDGRTDVAWVDLSE